MKTKSGSLINTVTREIRSNAILNRLEMQMWEGSLSDWKIQGSLRRRFRGDDNPMHAPPSPTS
jgi:hypothetical protein